MRFLLITALFIAACSKQESVNTSSLETRLTQLQVQAEQNQVQMEDMDKQIDELISEINDLTAENEALQNSLTQLAELEADQTADLAGLRALIESNNHHIHKYKDKIEKIYIALARRR